jgi:hypothetical protein
MALGSRTGTLAQVDFGYAFPKMGGVAFVPNFIWVEFDAAIM